MFSIVELSDACGYSPRYIRRLVGRGLLPRPTPARGKYARYPAEALRRCKFIRARNDQLQTLADLAERWGAERREDAGYQDWTGPICLNCGHPLDAETIGMGVAHGREAL